MKVDLRRACCSPPLKVDCDEVAFAAPLGMKLNVERMRDVAALVILEQYSRCVRLPPARLRNGALDVPATWEDAARLPG